MSDLRGFFPPACGFLIVFRYPHPIGIHHTQIVLRPCLAVLRKSFRAEEFLRHPLRNFCHLFRFLLSSFHFFLGRWERVSTNALDFLSRDVALHTFHCFDDTVVISVHHAKTIPFFGFTSEAEHNENDEKRHHDARTYDSL